MVNSLLCGIFTVPNLCPIFVDNVTLFIALPTCNNNLYGVRININPIISNLMLSSVI